MWMKLGSEANLWLSFAGSCEELAQFPVYSMDSLFICYNDELCKLLTGALEVCGLYISRIIDCPP
jgi:hypothetical protein